MASGFVDFVRDVEAEIAQVLSENPSLTREDLEVLEVGGVVIKPEAVERLRAENPEAYIPETKQTITVKQVITPSEPVVVTKEKAKKA